jgi:hypothetical protein
MYLCQYAKALYSLHHHSSHMQHCIALNHSYMNSLLPQILPLLMHQSCDSTARIYFIILEANTSDTKGECSANVSGKIMSPCTAACGEASIPYTATASFMCTTAAVGESAALSPMR